MRIRRAAGRPTLVGVSGWSARWPGQLCRLLKKARNAHSLKSEARTPTDSRAHAGASRASPPASLAALSGTARVTSANRTRQRRSNAQPSSVQQGEKHFLLEIPSGGLLIRPPIASNARARRLLGVPLPAAARSRTASAIQALSTADGAADRKQARHADPLPLIGRTARAP